MFWPKETTNFSQRLRRKLATVLMISKLFFSSFEVYLKNIVYIIFSTHQKRNTMAQWRKYAWHLVEALGTVGMWPILFTEGKTNKQKKGDGVGVCLYESCLVSFINSIRIKCLPCPRHCFRHWELSEEQTTQSQPLWSVHFYDMLYFILRKRL